MSADLDQLRDAGWRRLLAAARRRLEHTGGALEGTIGLNAPTEAERRVVIGITGGYRPETAKRLTVHLGDLDLALRDRHGTGLLGTLAALDGPLRDRPAERAAEDRLRAEALAAAGSPLAETEPWFTAWLSALLADGTLTRLVRRADGRLLAWAVRVLERLHRRDSANAIPLTVLAEWTCGDTKALLPGSPLSTLVLRALALRAGLDSVPRDRVAQRTLWESAGAIGDDLASQVLLLNVRCAGSDVVSGWLADAADFGIPFRLTLHQQAADPIVPDAADLYVCENPAVLRVAAAELGAQCPPLVCTEGVPSAACQKLVTAAVAAGVRLHWRADFDWTGLRIVGAAAAAHQALPWRMTATDYGGHLDDGDSTPLSGAPTASPWDPALADLMRAHGRAVMEERLIATLLADLTAGAR